MDNEFFKSLFYVRPSDFAQSVQGQTCHGCISFDTVIDFCSKMLMRLYYCIYIGFGKKLLFHVGIKPESSTLPVDQSVRSPKLHLRGHMPVSIE